MQALDEALDILQHLALYSTRVPAPAELQNLPFVRGTCALHVGWADTFKVCVGP